MLLIRSRKHGAILEITSIEGRRVAAQSAYLLKFDNSKRQFHWDLGFHDFPRGNAGGGGGRKLPKSCLEKRPVSENRVTLPSTAERVSKHIWNWFCEGFCVAWTPHFPDCGRLLLLLAY